MSTMIARAREAAGNMVWHARLKLGNPDFPINRVKPYITPQGRRLVRITPDADPRLLEGLMVNEKVIPFGSYNGSAERDLQMRLGGIHPRRMIIAQLRENDPSKADYSIQIALTSGPATNLAGLVEGRDEVRGTLNTIVCYSVSVWEGCAIRNGGTEFVHNLMAMSLSVYPNLLNLVTLSPVTDFLRHVEKGLLKPWEGHINGLIKSTGSGVELPDVMRVLNGKDNINLLHRPAMALAARILVANYIARAMSGAEGSMRTLNGVAHFHLGNSAALWDICPLADTSPIGLERSGGMMAIFRYPRDPAKLRPNKTAYRSGAPVVSNTVAALLQPQGVVSVRLDPSKKGYSPQY